MLFLPGSLVSLLTFPGIIVHEASHKFFCDLMGVKVFEVKYFGLGKIGGYVIHEKTTNLKANFFISVGPLLINSLLCVIIAGPAMIALSALGIQSNNYIYVLAWLGLSIGMHAFPSNDDLNNFMDSLRSSAKLTLTYIISWPFVLIIKIANALRVLWFDLIYAVGLAWILPVLFSNNFNGANGLPNLNAIDPQTEINQQAETENYETNPENIYDNRAKPRAEANVNDEEWVEVGPPNTIYININSNPVIDIPAPQPYNFEMAPSDNVNSPAYSPVP